METLIAIAIFALLGALAVSSMPGPPPMSRPSWDLSRSPLPLHLYQLRRQDRQRRARRLRLTRRYTRWLSSRLRRQLLRLLFPRSHMTKFSRLSRPTPGRPRKL